MTTTTTAWTSAHLSITDGTVDVVADEDGSTKLVVTHLVGGSIKVKATATLTPAEARKVGRALLGVKATA